MTKQAVARKYRTIHPDYPTLKLARIIYNENHILFKGVEDARSALRTIEGKNGDRKRKDIKDKSLFIEKDRPKNPYKLPDSFEAKWEPYKLEHKRIGVICDLHIPYHNIEATSVAIAHFKKEKPDAILLNGDALDFYGLSRYCRDPKQRSFAQELEAWKQMFDVLQRELDCKIYYKLGNHEERYEQFLFQKAGELVGVDEFEISSLLSSRAQGIEIIKDKQIIKAGGLNIAHGHEFGGSVFSPVNIARGLFLRAKTSAMQGHNHQTSEHTESDMNGKITTTWSVGCLCELHPAYLPINKWNHGIALVDVDGEDFEVRNKRIFKGKLL